MSGFLLRSLFSPPRIVEAITEGRAPADLTTSGLVRNLPIGWAEQEKGVGLS